MAYGTLQKPRPRVLDKLDARRADDKALREAIVTVRRRDGGKCRACGKPGAHAHHIVYRSHGGSDEPGNLIWACVACHRLIHAKVLIVRFDPKHPAKTIRFERNRQWD